MENIQTKNSIYFHKILTSILTMLLLYMAINILIIEMTFLNYLYLEILFSISKKLFNLATHNII
jgi:hypothetical protein